MPTSTGSLLDEECSHEQGIIEEARKGIGQDQGRRIILSIDQLRPPLSERVFLADLEGAGTRLPRRAKSNSCLAARQPVTAGETTKFLTGGPLI